ncbi:protein MLN51 homolog isoform X1 [Nymphaea colorata]|nr:protein MLN51 homolog isoform X1 [Nymphaea colorata]XP_031488128.1 protein MLN51 homolog isoform X1 [Nymphaea colorata]XP_031488132.1 protein MLN51 homolog isoform X1 [Nymphaea colorata]
MAVEGGEPELPPNPAGISVQDDDEAEYESDSEAVVPLALRRREASDDEDGEEEEGRRRRDRRVAVESEGDSDAEGRPAAYEEEEEVELEGEGEEREEFEEEELLEEEDIGEGDDVGEGVAQEVTLVASRSGEEGSRDRENEASPAEQDFHGKNRAAGAAEDKKENEPFAVPTAGAFYMHDDRFRDSGGARHRRIAGGRKLWESKDDRAWVHDRFEEMNMKEEQYNEKRRGSRGHFRGRGRTGGRERGFARGTGPRYFDENKTNRTLNQPQRIVKGRGPRKYDPAKNKMDTLSPRDKQPVRLNDTNASTGGGRSSPATPTLQPEMVPARKHVFASSLNSASPPFYPSGQDISSTPKRHIQAGNAGRSTTNSANSVDENGMGSNTNISMRGKAVVDSIGQDEIQVDQSMHPVIEKALPNVQVHASGSSPSVSGAQSSQTKVQGKGLVVSGQMNYPVAPSSGTMNRISTQAPVPAQQRLVQGQSTLRSSIQQLSQRPGSGPQESSSSQVSSVASLHEVDEVESPEGSSKSKLSFSGTGKVAPQGNGKASFLYGGAQVIGSTNAEAGGRGDQTFPPTPALLPVMQFGGQHHGGLGVPAVGMAFPGYVGQPQAGFGNSEMTWLPVLAGAAGALGASYCSPYFAFDGGYYNRSSGQTSSASSSRDSTSSKSANTWKTPHKPVEVVNDEFGQRQNKPRRYSEMNFGQ